MNTQDKYRCDALESYMLGELDEAAALSFERHMNACPVCRTQMELLWPAHDMLAYEEPGPMDVEWAVAMKDGVLAAVLQSRPPQAERVEDRAPGAADHTAGAVDRKTGVADHMAGAADPQTGAADRTIEHPRWQPPIGRRRRAPFRMSIYTVSEATLLIGIALGSLITGGWWTSGPAAATQVLVDAPMKPTAFAPLAQGSVMLLGTQTGREIIVTVHGLHPLPSSQCYNVWFVNGAHSRVLAGMITVNGNGAGALSAMVPANLVFHYVGITREPHLNDVVPKGPKVLGAPLTSS
ncbi:MAG: anti-sigma factor [Bacilli bacterium]